MDGAFGSRYSTGIIVSSGSPRGGKPLITGGKLRIGCRNRRILDTKELGTAQPILCSAQILICQKNENDWSLSYEVLAMSGLAERAFRFIIPTAMIL